jgi:hypothetical protein
MRLVKEYGQFPILHFETPSAKCHRNRPAFGDWYAFNNSPEKRDN